MCAGLFAVNTPAHDRVLDPEPAETEGQVPSVGCIVRYVSYGTPGGEYPSVDRAAIITEVARGWDPNDVGLAVLNPEGMFFNRAVVYDAHGAPGTWHWPARV